MVSAACRLWSQVLDITLHGCRARSSSPRRREAAPRGPAARPQCPAVTCFISSMVRSGHCKTSSETIVLHGFVAIPVLPACDVGFVRAAVAHTSGAAWPRPGHILPSRQQPLLIGSDCSGLDAPAVALERHAAQRAFSAKLHARVEGRSQLALVFVTLDCWAHGVRSTGRSAIAQRGARNGRVCALARQIGKSRCGMQATLRCPLMFSEQRCCWLDDAALTSCCVEIQLVRTMLACCFALCSVVTTTSTRHYLHRR